MISSIPVLTLVLVIGAAVLLLGVAAFFVVRRRRRPIDPLPLSELEPEYQGGDAPAPLIESDDSSFAPAAAAVVPEQESHSDDDDSFAAAVPSFAAPAAEPTPASTPAPSAAPTPAPRSASATRVSFRMLLPTQGHARSAGQIARRDGYVADVQPPAEGSTMWQCALTREMIASPEAIGEEASFLGELAASFGGHLES